eukprot:jgi/Tetstr1/423441/TSEL_014122.t1
MSSDAADAALLTVRSRKVVFSARVPASSAAANATLITSDAGEAVVQPSKTLTLHAPLSLPGIPDTVQRVRHERATNPVLDGVINATFALDPIPLSKFRHEDVLLVSIGGTGSGAAPPGALLVGNGDGALVALSNVVIDGDTVHIAGALTREQLDDRGVPTGRSVSLASRRDRVGRPAMELTNLIGEVTNVLAPWESLFPAEILSVAAGPGPGGDDTALQVTFKALRPRRVVASFYKDLPPGRKTSAEALAGYCADVFVAEDLPIPPDEGQPFEFGTFPSRSEMQVTMR